MLFFCEPIVSSSESSRPASASPAPIRNSSFYNSATESGSVPNNQCHTRTKRCLAEESLQTPFKGGRPSLLGSSCTKTNARMQNASGRKESDLRAFEGDLEFLSCESEVLAPRIHSTCSNDNNPMTPRAVMTPGGFEGRVLQSVLTTTPSSSSNHDQKATPRALGLMAARQKYPRSRLFGRPSPSSSGSSRTCSKSKQGSWAGLGLSRKRLATQKKQVRSLKPDGNISDADQAATGSIDAGEKQINVRRQGRHKHLPTVLEDTIGSKQGEQVFVERGMGRDSAGNLGTSGLLGSFYGASSQQ